MNEYEKWEERRRQWHLAHVRIWSFVWALLLGTCGVSVGTELWGVTGLIAGGLFGVVTGVLAGAGMAYQYHPDHDSDPRMKVIYRAGIACMFIMLVLVEWLRWRS